MSFTFEFNSLSFPFLFLALQGRAAATGERARAGGAVAARGAPHPHSAGRHDQELRRLRPGERDVGPAPAEERRIPMRLPAQYFRWN